MCDLGEEGDECRFGQLAQDQQALKDRVLSKTSNAPITRDGKAQTGQAASVINDEYFKLSVNTVLVRFQLRGGVPGPGRISPWRIRF